MRIKAVKYFNLGAGNLSKPKEFDGMRCTDTYTPESVEQGAYESSDGIDESFTLRQLWQECIEPDAQIDLLGNGSVRVWIEHESYVSNWRTGEEQQESVHCTLPAGPAARAFLRGARKIGVLV